LRRDVKGAFTPSEAKQREKLLNTGTTSLTKVTEAITEKFLLQKLSHFGGLANARRSSRNNEE